MHMRQAMQKKCADAKVENHLTHGPTKEVHPQSPIPLPSMRRDLQPTQPLQEPHYSQEDMQVVGGKPDSLFGQRDDNRATDNHTTDNHATDNSHRERRQQHCERRQRDQHHNQQPPTTSLRSAMKTSRT
jgi:hypothetical protein